MFARSILSAAIFIAALTLNASSFASDDHAPSGHEKSAPAKAAQPAAAKSHGATSHAAAAPDDLNPDQIWAKLQIGNRRFVQGRPMHHNLVDARGELAKGQHPWVIVLGCSDSRVSPELVFDQGLGDMFVVRTAGNIADPVALGSMEYAIEHLHASAIVVLGHEKCGAVTAATTGERMPTANLEAVVSRIQPALVGLRDVVSGAELIERGINANVQHCALDLLDNSDVIRDHVDRHEVAILKAVYDLDTGEVMRLE